MCKLTYLSILIVIAITVGLSCASPGKKSNLFTEKNIRTIASESEIVLNYILDKKAIRDTFNRSIDRAIVESFSEQEDGLKIYIKRKKSVEVEFEGKSVLVTLPIDITMIKHTFVKDLKVKGVLELVFISNLDIDDSWNLDTKTMIAYFKWLETPKVDIRVVKIPIEGIVNRVLKDYKPQIERNIDLSIKNSFDLRSRAIQNLSALREPIKVTDPIEGYFQIIPIRAYFSGASNLAESTNGKIALVCDNIYTLQPPTASDTRLQNELPPLSYRENLPDSSVIRINTRLDKASLNKWVNQNFQGKTFKDEDKSITVKNIVIHTTSGMIRADVDVSGSFNGRLQLKGVPSYDSVKNVIYADNVDLSIKSKNILHSAFSWLFKGKIRRNLESTMTFPLDEKTADIQQKVNDQLSKINKRYELELKADIGSIRLDDVKVTDDEIIALVRLKAWLQMKVSDFRSFNKF